jgi:hypothetical protein
MMKFVVWLMLFAGAWGALAAAVGTFGAIISIAIGSFELASTWARIGAWGVIVALVCFTGVSIASHVDK